MKIYHLKKTERDIRDKILKVKEYYIYTVYKGGIYYTDNGKDSLNLEDLIPVVDREHRRYSLFAYKQDFAYDYFLNNPSDIKAFDLEFTQNKIEVFTEQQFNYLKFLKKVI